MDQPVPRDVSQKEHVGAIGTPAPAAGPVQPTERLVVLDVLRGFALLGIIQVNWPGGPRTSTMVELKNFLVTGSFLAAFSLLFGIGFALQLTRAEERKRHFVGRYLWRSLLLFAIGASHAMFLWSGDVVGRYAYVSVVLLLFVRWPARLLLPMAGLFLAFSMYRGPVPEVGIVNIVQRLDTARLHGQERIRNARITQLRVVANETGRYGDRVRSIAFRADLPHLLLSLTTLPGLQRNAQYIALFLLGLWIGRRRILPDLVQHTRLLMAVGLGGLVVGLAGNANTVFGAFGGPLASWRLDAFWDISLGLSYLCILALGFTRSAHARRLLHPFSHVGRMSLTNYIMQTVLMMGLLRLGLTAVSDGQSALRNQLVMLGTVNAVFLLQVLYSRWWFSRFMFGPLEWAWRSATWFRVQPFGTVAIAAH